MIFSLTSGKALPFQPGLPPGYPGPVLQGSSCSYMMADFADIVVQEIGHELVTLKKILVHWKKPERLLCQYNYSPGIFSRVALNHSLHEYLKGAGEVYLKKEQFSVLQGSKWMGVLSAEKPGEHHFIDIAWNKEFRDNPAKFTLPPEPSDHHNGYEFVERLTGAPQSLTPGMLHFLQRLHDLDFSDAHYIKEQMTKYYQWMAEEVRTQRSVKKHLKETDWENISRARQLIDLNLDKHFTIPEISAIVGVNDYKLKKLFPKVTGFKIDEYRKYQLCVKAGKKIMRYRDEPLKSFCTEAGYTNLTNFIRGFRKLCCCKPGELREESWDVKGLSNHSNELE
jgi:AraC-like DNA-binding protein